MWSEDTNADTGWKQNLSMAKNSSEEKIIPSESQGERQFAYGDEHGKKATGGCVRGEEDTWRMSTKADWDVLDV